MAGADFGSVVRRLRSAGGLSQRELASRLHVDPTYISHLEANRREPSIQLLRRLASELSIPTGILLAMVIWDDLADDERKKYEPLVSRLVEVATIAQLKLPISESDEESGLAE